MENRIYSRQEAFDESLKYFNGNELQANVFITKYALRDSEGNYHESNPNQMHRRLAKEFARIENKYPNPLTEEEIYEYLKDFMKIVPQGSPMFGIGNNFQNVSISNCGVIPGPEDNMSSIMNTARDMANLYKRRYGIGTDVSNLRPDGAPVNNASVSSSGAWSFCDLYSYVTRMVGQSGRRGALILTMDCRHPDIFKFITMKSDLTKVTGANVSIKISDKFMEAVDKDLDWDLCFPVDSDNVFSTVKARELFDLISKEATANAEPGVLFWDTVCEYHPLHFYPEFEVICVNPCLSGETLVYTADGRGNVSIQQLFKEGKDVDVFCFDDNGRVVIRKMRNPRITGLNQPIYKITLDDGSEIKTTENHKFKLRTGEYKQVKDLKKGDSLKLLTKYEASFRDIFKNKNSSDIDYYWLNSGLRRNKSEHRIIIENQINRKLKTGEVVHHIDYNSKNNSLDNLQVMSKKDHDELHSLDMIGDKNPMRRAKMEWSQEKWDEFKNKQSLNNKEHNNNNFSGVNNETIREFALRLTKKLGRRFSVGEWSLFAKENNLPQQFSDWRKESLNSVKYLSKWSCEQLNIKECNFDTRLLRTLKKMIDSGYNNCHIVNNQVFIEKKCEICEKKFIVDHLNREKSFCSRKCIGNHLSVKNKNKKNENFIKYYKKRMEEIQNKQVEIFSSLVFNLNRSPKRKEWESECKEQGVPFRLDKNSKYGFKNFKEIKESATVFNHKVVSVEVCGYDTVYNGTVDDFHNFFVGGWEGKTKNGKRKLSYINNLQCGEVLLAANDSCRLLTQYLASLVVNPFRDEAYIDYDELKKRCIIAMRLCDDIIDLETEKLETIKELANTEDEKELYQKFIDMGIKGRRTGIGTHGLADMLARLKVKYDSDESLKIIDDLYSFIKNELYRESINLAKERGPFPIFDWEIEKNCKFWDNMPEDIIFEMKKYGRRNGAILTNAPTGSVSILSENCSSGMEPVFRFEYVRRKKINHNENIEADFVDQNGDRWTEYKVYHSNLNKYFQEMKVNPNDKLPDYFISSEDVDWSKRVDIQGIIQKHVDHSLSTTINLPEGTTSDVVSNIYKRSHAKKCKGATVYVDGSRSGVLISSKQNKEVLEEDCHACKRPQELECEVHFLTVDKKPWVTFVGMLNNRPYEIFTGLADDVKPPKSRTNGYILKRKRGVYDLYFDKGSDKEIVFKDITSHFVNNEYATQTRMISTMLRHRIPINYIVEQLQKNENEGLMSFSKTTARVLKKYIPDHTSAKSYNSECFCENSDECNMVYMEGCVTCKTCGWSKCS